MMSVVYSCVWYAQNFNNMNYYFLPGIIKWGSLSGSFKGHEKIRLLTFFASSLEFPSNELNDDLQYI